MSGVNYINYDHLFYEMIIVVSIIMIVVIKVSRGAIEGRFLCATNVCH